MQTGGPQGPYSEQVPVVPVQTPMMTTIPHGMTLVTPEPVPLSPAPSNLQMARPSRPWRKDGRIVLLVILLFLFEIFLFDGVMVAIYGEPLYGALSMISAIKLLI